MESVSIMRNRSINYKYLRKIYLGLRQSKKNYLEKFKTIKYIHVQRVAAKIIKALKTPIYESV